MCNRLLAQHSSLEILFSCSIEKDTSMLFGFPFVFNQRTWPFLSLLTEKVLPPRLVFGFLLGLFYFKVWAFVGVQVWVCTCEYMCTQQPEVLDIPGAGVQAAVSHQTCVLRAQLGSSESHITSEPSLQLLLFSFRISALHLVFWTLFRKRDGIFFFKLCI